MSEPESWVADLQTALNERAAPRGYPSLLVDGILGPLTQQAVQDVGHALGIEPELLVAEQLAPEVVRLFSHPTSRSSSQVEIAGQRSTNLAAREIELDGVKVAWGLAKPLVRARAAGWAGTLEHAAHGADPLEAVFEGAWWHRILEVSHEGELSALLTQMGYACELVAHSKGIVGRSGLRFLEQPGEVEPSAAEPASALQADPSAASPPAETPAPAPITGIDVSAEQGEIDWDQVASAGHGFAFIRASSGVNAVDGRFAANWRQAGAAGLRRGAYHLAEPTSDSDAGDQAVNMVAAIRSFAGIAERDLPPSVVIDDLAGAIGGQRLVDWVQAFSSAFARITHGLPAIRISADTLARALGSDPSGINGPVWISAGESAGAPAPPAPQAASFEALAEDEQCPGISGPCQLSRFRGSQEQFDQLGSGAQTTN